MDEIIQTMKEEEKKEESFKHKTKILNVIKLNTQGIFHRLESEQKYLGSKEQSYKT